MIDSHCHLNFRAFRDDYREVYKRAIKNEVEKMVVVGTRIDSSEKAIALAKELKGVYASVGVHPHHLDEMGVFGQDELKRRLQILMKKSKVVAVGETGLDYYRYKNTPQLSHNDKEKQRNLLMIHLELIKTHRLPVIFHCRDAFDDMLVFLVQSFKGFKYLPRGVFHCFSGSKKHLKNVLDMGLYVGFDGNISYRENKYLREVVISTPLNRLLLETDAPFLTPDPHRGKRNEPANTSLVAKWVAKIKKLTVKEVIEQTTKNSNCLFDFKT